MSGTYVSGQMWRVMGAQDRGLNSEDQGGRGISFYNSIHWATGKKDQLLCDSSDTLRGQECLCEEAMSQLHPDK